MKCDLIATGPFEVRRCKLRLPDVNSGQVFSASSFDIGCQINIAINLSKAAASRLLYMGLRRAMAISVDVWMWVVATGVPCPYAFVLVLLPTSPKAALWPIFSP